MPKSIYRSGFKSSRTVQNSLEKPESPGNRNNRTPKKVVPPALQPGAKKQSNENMYMNRINEFMGTGRYRARNGQSAL